MDGVLYRGNAALPGLREFFDFLEQSDIKYLLVTNNSTMSSVDYNRKLAKMGVDIPASLIVTSGEATAQWVRKTAPEGAGIFVVGEPPLKQALLSEDGLYYWDDQQPRFVIQGADFHLVYETVRKACLLIRKGAQFIVTNADPVFPSEEGLIPGAGSIGALLRTATGQNPFVVGKPEPTMYMMALEQLGATIEQTVMIGDNLVTDIEGANRLGMKTILTLSGVTSAAEAASDPVKATENYVGLPELIEAWKASL
jgi:4-nitrophenyl phosphatase